MKKSSSLATRSHLILLHIPAFFYTLCNSSLASSCLFFFTWHKNKVFTSSSQPLFSALLSFFDILRSLGTWSGETGVLARSPTCNWKELAATKGCLGFFFNQSWSGEKLPSSQCSIAQILWGLCRFKGIAALQIRKSFLFQFYTHTRLL